MAGTGTRATRHHDTLEADRTRNDQSLKSRFEHIFRKYDHDFTGVADEIDIHAGEIVVNNGHIEHMRSDVDPGRTAASHLLHTFWRRPGHEEASAESGGEGSPDGSSASDQGESADDNADGNADDSADDNADVSADDNADVSADDNADDSADDNADDIDEPRAASTLQQDPTLAWSDLKRPAPRLAQILVATGGAPQHPIAISDEHGSISHSAGQGASEAVTPAAILAAGIEQSASALASSTEKRAAVDAETIQALGTSIARQLARLMDGPARTRTKSSKSIPMMGAREPLWDYPRLPHVSETKRKRSPIPSHDTRPPVPLSASPPSSSLWSAGLASEHARKRQRRNLYAQAAEPPVRRFGANASTSEHKRCWNCSLTRSPNWITGPHGQDLCASCGQYYQQHACMKPFDSPTPPPVDVAPFTPRTNAKDIDCASPAERNIGPMPLQPGISVQDHEPVFSAVHQSPTPPPKVSPSPPISYRANTCRPLVPTRGSIGRSRFSPEEDALIIKLKESDQLDWEMISKRLPNRSATSVQVRYSCYLRGNQSVGRTLFKQTTGSTEAAGIGDLNPNWWSEQHDQLLLEFVEERALGWYEIASLLSGGDVGAAKKRYEVLAERPDEEHHQSPHDTSIEESSLSPQKDGPLECGRLAADDLAVPASHIAASISQEGDSQPQLEAADIENNLVTSPRRRYTPEENHLLISLRDQGLDWQEMAKHFPGRPATSLQKHFETKFMMPVVRLRKSLPATQSSATPLLRHALGNSLQRSSDTAGQSVPHSPNDGPTQPRFAFAGHDTSSLPLDLGITSQEHSIEPYADDLTLAQDEALAASLQLNEELLHSSDTRPEHVADMYHQASFPELPRSPTPGARIASVGVKGLDNAEVETSTVFTSTGYAQTCTVEFLEHSATPQPVTDGHAGPGLHADLVPTQITTALVDVEPSPLAEHDPAAIGKQPQLYDHDEELASSARPDLSWLQLIRMAFEATQAEKLKCSDICHWIETNYGHCCPENRPWKHKVRNELERGIVARRCGEEEDAGYTLKHDMRRQADCAVSAEDPTPDTEEELGPIDLMSDRPEHEPRFEATSHADHDATTEAEISEIENTDVQARSEADQHGYDSALAVLDAILTTAAGPEEPVGLPSRHVTFNPEVIVTTPIEMSFPRRHNSLGKTRRSTSGIASKQPATAMQRRSARVIAKVDEAAGLADDPLSSPATVVRRPGASRSKGHGAIDPSVRRLAQWKTRAPPRKKTASNVTYKRIIFGTDTKGRPVGNAVNAAEDPDEDELA